MENKQAVREIIERLKIAPDDPEVGPLVRQIAIETHAYEAILETMMEEYGAWMALTVFTVAFVRLKVLVSVAEGTDKEALKMMMETVIGSFGKQLN